MGRVAWVVVAAGLLGCSAPILTPDGQVVFAESGATRGGSVLTAHGVQFLDNPDTPPQPIARKSADDPWIAPTGFLLPTDGVWRETSTPTSLEGKGLRVVVRTSDLLVPSWGGELLLRLDALAPVDAFPIERDASLRAPMDITLVVDGSGGDLPALIEAATDGLGQRDRIALVHTDPPRVILPPLPGTHRTLVRAAAEHATSGRHAPASRRDLERAAELARATKRRPGAPHHVVLLGESSSRASATAVAGLEVPVGDTLEERLAWLAEKLPPPGDVVLRDVAIRVASNPAPARIIEPSGGSPSLALYDDELYLGDMYVGEARTEVVRVSLPVWVEQEPIELFITATYSIASDGRAMRTRETIPLRYSADIDALSNRRHGDVIAYASALAMVRRLDRAFLRDDGRAQPDLRKLAAWQARSLGELAQKRRDPALSTQAEVLGTLARTLGP